MQSSNQALRRVPFICHACRHYSRIPDWAQTPSRSERPVRSSSRASPSSSRNERTQRDSQPRDRERHDSRPPQQSYSRSSDFNAASQGSSERRAAFSRDRQSPFTQKLRLNVSPGRFTARRHPSSVSSLRPPSAGHSSAESASRGSFQRRPAHTQIRPPPFAQSSRSAEPFRESLEGRRPLNHARAPRAFSAQARITERESFRDVDRGAPHSHSREPPFTNNWQNLSRPGKRLERRSPFRVRSPGYSSAKESTAREPPTQSFRLGTPRDGYRNFTERESASSMDPRQTSSARAFNGATPSRNSSHRSARSGVSYGRESSTAASYRDSTDQRSASRTSDRRQFPLQQRTGAKVISGTFARKPPFNKADIRRGPKQLGRNRPRPSNMIGRPPPPPISRGERQEINARQKLEKDIRLQKKPTHDLSNPRKEAAEKWKRRHEQPPNPKSASTASPHSPPQTAASIPSSIFATYKSTNPPTPAQLAYSNRFFTTGRPTFLFSSAKFRTLPKSSVPEVAFLGRSNVGKSSLLNALVHRTGTHIAAVSSKPGRTRTMNAFGVGGEGGGVRVVRGAAEGPDGVEDGKGRERNRWVGRGGLVVLDMPGYGQASREEWGREIVKYLRGRKQLRRTFVLIDSEHGLKPTDHQLFSLLRLHGIPHQLVLTKIDKLVHARSSNTPPSAPQILRLVEKAQVPALCKSVLQALAQAAEREGKAGVPVLEDVLTVSAEVEVGGGRKIGVENLRWAVLAAAGLECDAEGRKRVVEAGDLEVRDEEGVEDEDEDEDEDDDEEEGEEGEEGEELENVFEQPRRR